MTPLFAVTQMSQSMGSSEDSVDGQIRATQDVQQFTATMDEAGTVVRHKAGVVGQLSVLVFLVLDFVYFGILLVGGGGGGGSGVI